MRTWVKTLCVWLAIGGVAGLVVAGVDALSVERDLQHGLLWLAADRALAVLGASAVAGCALAALFTGAYPMRHGAKQEQLSLAPRFATVAEVLRDAGWATFAASANPIVSRAAGLDQGFASFVDAWRSDAAPEQAGSPSHPVVAAFQSFLAGAARGRPFFAFLNYMEAHSPYTPAPESMVRFVAQLSAEIGRLLDVLRQDGRYDDTIVVVTSDHGEQFGEHGLVEHMFSLYELLLHIPMLLRLPGGERAGEVDERIGQLVDLAPALLRLCGVDVTPLERQGADLLDADEMARAAPRLAPSLRRLRSLTRDGHKLLRSSDGRRELYDLRADPNEAHDLGAAPVASDLEARLDAVLARYATPNALAAPRLAPRVSGLAAAVDADTAARLRELGYVR